MVPHGGELSDLDKLISLCVMGVIVCAMYIMATDTGDWEL